jgi:hypothetical protein
MGLFDGFDPEALMRMLNPMGTANAAEAPMNLGGLTPEALVASQVAKNPTINPATFTSPGATLLPTGGDTGVGLPPAPPAVVPPVEPVRLQGSTFGTTPPPPLPADVGAALSGSAEPVAASAAAPFVPQGASAATDISARAKTPDETRPSLSQALRGVVAPKPPELQKIASPNAPRATGTIKGGDLQALLMALNAGAAGKIPTLGGR